MARAALNLCNGLPGQQIAPSAIAVAHQPGVVGGQVELARARGFPPGLRMLVSHSLSRRWWPALPARRSGSAAPARCRREPQRGPPARLVGCCAVPAEPASASRVLQQVAFQVSARSDFEDLEQHHQRRMVAVRMALVDEEASLSKRSSSRSSERTRSVNGTRRGSRRLARWPCSNIHRRPAPPRANSQ